MKSSLMDPPPHDPREPAVQDTYGELTDRLLRRQARVQAAHEARIKELQAQQARERRHREALMDCQDCGESCAALRAESAPDQETGYVSELWLCDHCAEARASRYR